MLECLPEAGGELEMPQVIGRKLHLVATRIARERAGHYARAVDQQMEGGTRGKEG
ncbi:hypothetical protein D3C79_685470 [compost metagenome]